MSVAQWVLCESKAISWVLAGHKSVFVNVRLLLNHVSGAVAPICEATTRSFLLFFIFGVVRRQGLPTPRGAVMPAAFLELTLCLIIINIQANIRICT
jgi:hypothetical protein